MEEYQVTKTVWELPTEASKDVRGPSKRHIVFYHAVIYIKLYHPPYVLRKKNVISQHIITVEGEKRRCAEKK